MSPPSSRRSLDQRRPGPGQLLMQDAAIVPALPCLSEGRWLREDRIVGIVSGRAHTGRAAVAPPAVPQNRRSPRLEKPASGGCHGSRTGRGAGDVPRPEWRGDEATGSAASVGGRNQRLVRTDSASFRPGGHSSATALPPRLSAGTDPGDAGWCRFEPARPIGSSAGQWRPRPVVEPHSLPFPAHFCGFPRRHQQRLAGAAGGASRADEGRAVANRNRPRHPSKRCAVGPRRQKRSDALSEKTKRCAVGSQVGFYLATINGRKILPGYMGQEAGPTPASARDTRDLARGAGSDPRGPLVPGAGGGLAVPYVRRSEELQWLQGAVRGGVARGTAGWIATGSVRAGCRAEGAEPRGNLFLLQLIAQII